MHVLYGVKDIFALPKTHNEAVCITTNGIVKANGSAVMGAGVAKQANTRFNGLPLDLGARLSKYGNRAYDMGWYKDNASGNLMRIITFPTKHHWRDESSLSRIKVSAEQLLDICDRTDLIRCYLPCPGCGNGGLIGMVRLSLF